MKKLKAIFTRYKRKIFGLLSLSTALFIFQACYGTPQDFGADILINGIVKSKKTNNPVQGIKVSVGNHHQYDYTNEMGEFRFYTEIDSIYNIRFEDIDSTENLLFKSNDTVFKNVEDEIFVEIFLDE